MRDVTLVILNSLRIKCHIRRPLTTFNWVSGSPPILYKLAIGPIPIVHTNFQENPLTTVVISRHFKII